MILLYEIKFYVHFTTKEQCLKQFTNKGGLIHETIIQVNSLLIVRKELTSLYFDICEGI